MSNLSIKLNSEWVFEVILLGKTLIPSEINCGEKRYHTNIRTESPRCVVKMGWDPQLQHEQETYE